jgi:excisionase family DNA binding protein
MSSNLEIQKVCEFCGKDFTARKFSSKTCSDICAKRLYKLKKRGEKIEQVKAETLSIKTMPFEVLKAKEFLSVRDVSKLIGCSRQTVYSLINSGKLKAVNIKMKKTIVPRAEIDNLFKI